MVEIEPYDFQKKTNIKEHNDIVGKINEIIDVVNNTSIETIEPRLDKLDSDIVTINNTDSLQWTDIETLKTKTKENADNIAINKSDIDGIKESLVSDVVVLDGYTAGNFKVRIERAGAVSIDSNEYSLESPVSIELIQGTGPSMFKCQITLSNGETLVSNDFVFTTEYIGQDLYISSFTFKNGNLDGTISADIGLNNGTIIEANNFVVPTSPTVTNAINDLNTRVESLENTTVSDARITAIETKNTEQDAEIETNRNDIAMVNTEIDNINTELDKKQTIVSKILILNASSFIDTPSYVSENKGNYYLANQAVWVDYVVSPYTEFKTIPALIKNGSSSPVSWSGYTISGDTIHYDVFLNAILEGFGIVKEKLTAERDYSIYLCYIDYSSPMPIYRDSTAYFQFSVSNGTINIKHTPTTIRSGTGDGFFNVAISLI